MKAVVVSEFGSSDVCKLAEVDPPRIHSDEVLIEVKTIGLNFSDIVHRRGDNPGTQELPYIPGREAAGVIVEVGPNTNHRVGDRVVALVRDGAYAEQVAATESELFEIPRGMSFTEAAGFPLQYLTAYHSLHTCGDISSGDLCLIHAAAGGVGTAAVQLAKDAGAEVYATASSAKKLEVAASLGADHTINYSDINFTEEVVSRTDERGVDLVLDSVGGDVFRSSLDSLASFGRVVAYGFASEEIPSVDIDKLLTENRAVFGFHLKSAIDETPRMIYAAVPELSRKLAEGELRVIVNKRFPLDEAAKAQEMVESRRSIGKVVLET